MNELSQYFLNENLYSMSCLILFGCVHQCFSYFNMHMNHLEILFKTQIWIKEIWGFIKLSGRLTLLVWGIYFVLQRKQLSILLAVLAPRGQGSGFTFVILILSTWVGTFSKWMKLHYILHWVQHFFVICFCLFVFCYFTCEFKWTVNFLMGISNSLQPP